MRIKGQKIPDSWVNCQICGKMYGWVNCRVSKHNPDREICLACSIVEGEAKDFTVKEKDTTKGTQEIKGQLPSYLKSRLVEEDISWMSRVLR